MLVIGNGESRKNIDISNISDTKIGCNAIHRDFAVRHLVCVDRKMVREALQNDYNKHALIYTRQEWFSEFTDIKGMRLVPDLPYVGVERPDQPIHWGSGPYAILLAAQLISKLKYKDNIHMIGFDLYGTEDKTVNNMYKDTDHYDLSNKRAVDPRYWIYQISKVFELYPNITFTIYNKENWDLPKSWKKKNINLDNINNIHYNINSALGETI